QIAEEVHVRAHQGQSFNGSLSPQTNSSAANAATAAPNGRSTCGWIGRWANPAIKMAAITATTRPRDWKQRANTATAARIASKGRQAKAGIGAKAASRPLPA